MGAVPEAAHGQEGVPDPTPEVEEETEELDPGEDGTGRDHGPMSEKGTETGTGGAIQHADAQGPVPAHGRGAVPGEEGGAVEVTGGAAAAAAAPLSPPAA